MPRARSAWLVCVNCGGSRCGFFHEGVEEPLHDVAGLHCHALDLIVLVERVAQEVLELGIAGRHGLTELDEWPGLCAYCLDVGGRRRVMA